MAAPGSSNTPVTQDTPITIKISVNDSLKKLKLPLRDLGAATLLPKLRQVLDIKSDQHVVLERYSDSAGGYIALSEANAQAFKTLIRAAKAKLKLRLKATVSPVEVSDPAENNKEVQMEETKIPAANLSRDSIAFDRRSVGSGIFQFREARASRQTLVNDEAPVPQPFTADRSSFFDKLAPASAQPQPSLAFRPREPVLPAVCRTAAWSVYCNACDKAMANEHYHCSICDDGDFDLCQECVSGGKLCPGTGHWLIKRFIKDGQVITSTTERISPRKVKSIPSLIKQEPEAEKEMPGAFTDETKTLAEEPRVPTRTCNSCVIVLPEREFVTCTSCDDFDLCIKCHTADAHGHHPAHGFKPATEETVLPLSAETKLAPGRNVRHNAICDGCDKKIYGVRHKCLNCPDWDYCNACIKNARNTHPRHRFAALYQPIADQGPSMVRHFGIYCDGPLCGNKTDQSYIQGVRYKCTICHDTDFCASCEALPSHHHNRTHPLIKLKTPVRNVNVSTENEDLRGNVRVMGDRRQASVAPSLQSVATETTPVQQANAATQVHTVAEFTPTEVKKEETQTAAAPAIPAAVLNAHFVCDTIPDGMVVQPEYRFTQIWTLKNPGPHAWPAGCSVRYVGGDNMLNVDNSHPVPVTAIADATESNVVGREVQVGEEVAFKLILKAPAREGKAISYWRLKAADGTPFGHRLWCDIEIKKAEQPASEPTPLQLQEQQLAMQRLRMQQMQMARQAAQQKEREQQARQQAMMQQHFMRQTPQQSRPQPRTIPSEQPPAYDVNLAARLAQQKQRREQMAAQLNAQRQQLLAQVEAFAPSREAEDLPRFAYPSGTKFDNMHEKEHRDALKQRVAALKANILKTREEREKLAEDFNKQRAADAEKKGSDDIEKVKKIVEEVAKQTDAEKEDPEESLEGSEMVFPKLDKESPSSSTYHSATSSSAKGKAAYVENEDGEVERSATPIAAQAPVPAPMSPTEVGDDFVDLDDELEVLSANGEESDDDGFLTDEEYDILDASDSETVASRH
ncbi:ZZ-type zinc finger-containing [Lecanosticta acicola]|uniref:ZZ-type zinc finger-containing n=1 Tax=Lecanosticta acicola TaxID=111012 RepID=A0AAI8YWG8_9PEZI|nr:ZZ-type zinc finger-containing [Lecanosticta acicola]